MNKFLLKYSSFENISYNDEEKTTKLKRYHITNFLYIDFILYA